MKRGSTRMFHRMIAGNTRGYLRLIRVDLWFVGIQFVALTHSSNLLAKVLVAAVDDTLS